MTSVIASSVISLNPALTQTQCNSLHNIRTVEPPKWIPWNFGPLQKRFGGQKIGLEVSVIYVEVLFCWRFQCTK